ncbi:MAG: VWA domain-containing protein [Vicinamibacterales bacterium]
MAIIMVATAALTHAQRVFRAGVDLVHFGVVVTDKAGQPVNGLTAEDFEVLEEGKPQTMQFFAGGLAEVAPPLHLGFLIDLSGSMAEDIKDVRTAAIKFLDAVHPVEDITLVDFDTEVRTARFASDDARLVERIRSRKPDGYTALYDAVGTYLDGASAQTGEKILVMYTDGGDTRSAMNQGELLDLLRASDVTVYAIGYLEHQGSARAGQQQVLQRFAGATGGQAFFPTRLKDLDKMYAKILREISARYSLGYVSTDRRSDGKWRDVRIRVIGPEFKDARVRTRPGYFAPYKPGSP